MSQSSLTMQVIGHIRSDFSTKFGIPRQSGLVDALRARVVFTPPYRNPDALRGLEDFSHLWLIWQFSQAVRDTWSPTVRPPRLGGNERMGVFATRSPFRPNPIGLSCVRLVEIRREPELGPVIVVAGADLMDGTPILDIKPYVPYADAHPEAACGFAPDGGKVLTVACPPELLAAVPPEKREALLGVLARDPRPSYQHDPDRIYGMAFAGLEVRFSVDGDTLTVRSLSPAICT
ncbi:tRNA (N6-threonylcarbamoyladenosine(37)-N6)-methyltransferase TrmO [Pseudoflavonifractor phocaeensis]|uniref:tRNA (N6-threonylcarbamoyladenosine(37)-N6)-methyltransferase TrmO n=1 Tax=Pseudoflavonifractor phocaeensis TaxID=1870988 RepID=UPI00195D11E3|nr:tRNA (N6-threonylcarbamoyladenosine(37)-N6)-methyltransferase TrmO [Pseudoflavonifractor phocaeensis]MBM6869678.1 tRNA (N6-threonylcarbamoyladenosine(37)-N6)-methyltransferase TrmO [Pseudoflavonifractor phocaeensis]MBM6938144.1 tRNA (N6-threonylcarbamoyladenosine(37)-N6)-methyltransferase TrmO [Pseudoflavonifractor phocaeensis]